MGSHNQHTHFGLRRGDVLVGMHFRVFGRVEDQTQKREVAAHGGANLGRVLSDSGCEDDRVDPVATAASTASLRNSCTGSAAPAIWTGDCRGVGAVVV